MSEQVYDHQYKAVLDGMETESMMEIYPAQRIEMFKMGNGTDEVLEVHDFKNVRVYDIHVKYFHCYVRDSAHISAIRVSQPRNCCQNTDRMFFFFSQTDDIESLKSTVLSKSKLAVMTSRISIQTHLLLAPSSF